MSVGLAQSAARGGAITVLSQLARLAFMVVGTIILARLLSPGDYGLMAMALAFVGVGEIFRDFGLSTSALRAKTLSHAQQSNLFWINVAVGIGLGALFFGASWLIALFFDVPALVPIIQLYVITFILNGLSTQFRVHINRDMRYLVLAAVDLVPYVAGIAVAIVTAVQNWGVWALVAQQLAVSALTLVMAVGLARWLPRLPSRAPMKELIGFGGSLAVTQGVSYLTRNVDSIAIGRVWGAIELGIYDRAYQLVVMPLNQINTPMSRVAIPTLSRLTEEPDRYAQYLHRAQLFGLYVTATLLGFFAGLGQQLIPQLLGPSWIATGTIFAILAIGAIFRALAQVAYWVFMTHGLASQQMRFYLIAQPLLAAVIISGVGFGALGVAIMHGVGYLAFWITAVLVSSRIAGISGRHLLLDGVRVIGTFSGPAGVIAWVVSTFAPVAPALAVALGALAGLGWLALVAAIAPRVRADIRDLVHTVRLGLRRNSS